jgi:pyrimidine-specific ribonucleoside hydrolase
MGGAIRGDNVTPTVEFNIWSDPEAARWALVDSDLPVTLVPIDLTHHATVDAAWINDLARSSDIGATLASLAGSYRGHYRRLLGRDVLAPHDALAVIEAIFPGTLPCRSTSLKWSAMPARLAVP